MEQKLLAQTTISLPPIQPPGPFENWLSWGEGATGAIEALKALTRIISNIIGVITIVAGIWFMFQFIVAGISWISAGGNKESISNAQARMRNAMIGIVIVVAALTIVGLFGKLLGIDILISEPGDLIEKLRP